MTPEEMSGEEQAALDAFVSYLDRYAQRDVEGCMRAVATSRPIMLFGTNENEIFKTREDVRSAFERDFGSMADIRWGTHRNIHVEASSKLANVLAELPVSYRSEGKEVKTLFRYALTFVLEDGQWKICSGMASVPFGAGTYEFSK